MIVDQEAGTDPTLAWFDHLTATGNTRELWAERGPAYAADVREPFAAYLAALDRTPGVPSHGPWRVYRPHNDRRFSPDGDPLKTFVGAVAETDGGGGVYTQVDAGGLLVAAGMPWLAPDQLAAWRAAVADPTSGHELADVVAGLEQHGLRLGADGRSRSPGHHVARPPTTATPSGCDGRGSRRWPATTGRSGRTRTGGPRWPRGCWPPPGHCCHGSSGTSAPLTCPAPAGDPGAGRGVAQGRRPGGLRTGG